MQLSVSFSALLAGVLVALCAQDVQAAPMPKPQPRMVTLPLTRMVARGDAHPLIMHQQNMNRASRRLALMTGREIPSDAMLTEALRKRVLSVEGPAGLERRFNRVGLAGANQEKRFNRHGVSTRDKRHKKGGKKAGKKAKAAGGVAAGAAAGAGVAGAVAGSAAPGNAVASGNATAAASGNATAAASGNATAASGNATAATGAAGAANALGGPDAAAGDVEVANAPTTANSLGLNIESQDVGYLATIQMGTPPQNYLILMDSGSADLWVASEACTSTAGGDCGQHQTLGSKSSSSFVASNTPFQVTYGTGAVAGALITDDVVVAGLQLKAHTFGVATQETVDFSADTVPFDGLMGLAQSTLSQQKTLTPVESLAQNGLIADAITSYKISRAADNKNDGEITFGALDTTKFDPATLTTITNVNTQGFWEGALDAVTVDGKDAGLAGRTAILDTGTTLMVAPVADATAVHQLITGSTTDGQGGFTVPCTFNQTVALAFGGATFNIDPRDIAVQPVDAANPTGDCLSGISGGSFGTSDTEWLVGDVFLKNAYYSTDVGKNTISLAKLV
ncbi:aspartic peptidase domain-containing protein [Mycena rosella]|uniref:Aspartic peptidase domain-containing protein n=1 Tax=Mycena rosella TaxID=1033263 RepID=A0AAD7D4C1_MYCRO|nr:aspartic peptidase domain-containing protein [Mycena rosella]